MPLSHKRIEDITEADLAALIENAVPEGRRIEYKSELPGMSERDRHHFLFAVSSFANAGGGDLIYGMAADAGIPIKLCGLSGIDPDATILRLDQMARSGIEPRVPGLHCRAVQLHGNRWAIVVRIPQSWALPHLVRNGEWYRCYSRSSNGKHPLDVHELRALFALSENTAERIRKFRDARLARIIANDGPVELDGTARLVLHLVPFAAAGPAARIDVRALEQRVSEIYSFSNRYSGWRYNLDGVLKIGDSLHPSRPPASYVQVFRDGSIEAVDAEVFAGDLVDGTVSGSWLDRDVVLCVRSSLKLLWNLGIEPPVVVLLALVGVRGYRMATGYTGLRSRGPYSIDRDVVTAPEVIIDDPESDPAMVIRPAIDAIWQAAGLAGSPNYREDGTFDLL